MLLVTEKKKLNGRDQGQRPHAFYEEGRMLLYILCTWFQNFCIAEISISCYFVDVRKIMVDFCLRLKQNEQLNER